MQSVPSKLCLNSFCFISELLEIFGLGSYNINQSISTADFPSKRFIEHSLEASSVCRIIETEQKSFVTSCYCGLGFDLLALWNLRIHWGPAPTPTPPFKSVRFEYMLYILYCNFHIEVRLGGWGLRGRRPRH